MKHSIFLLEIGTEELPASHVYKGIEELTNETEKLLKETRLSYKNFEVYGTPRRLVVLVYGLSEKQSEFRTEITGPAKRIAFDEYGKPTKAALGFAKAQGVSVKGLKIKKTEKGEFVSAVRLDGGKNTEELLPDICNTLIKSLDFPKSMHWHSSFRFSRPIRWLLAVYKNKLIALNAENVKSAMFSFGHRFLSPNKLKITDSSKYIAVLKKAHVELSHKKRREQIYSLSKNLTHKIKGTPLFDELLLDELTQLTELPVVVLCKFDSKFLELPQEVLIMVMEEHQKYIPVVSKDGKLMPYFIVVTNGIKENEELKRNHELVLTSRFDDAQFFYSHDIKTRLEDNVKALDEVSWVIGSLYKKVRRLKDISAEIASQLNVGDEIKNNVERASRLSKADQVTEMVKELPKLEGIIGSIYARKDGEGKKVADAIYEMYLPKFAGDKLPESTAGIILNISERIDNIAGCFLAGFNVTGSEDPYGIRKNALALINICLNSKLGLKIMPIIHGVSPSYEGLSSLNMELNFTTIEQKITDFLKQRFENILLERKIDYDIVRAVGANWDPFIDALERAEILMKSRRESWFKSTMFSFSRVANIIPKNYTETREIAVALFREEAEKNLYDTFVEINGRVKGHTYAGNYGLIFEELKKLCPYIDRFFDKVLVNTEDKEVRANRFALLKQIDSTLLKFADFSKIVIAS